MISQLRQPISVYDVARIVGEAFYKAFIPPISNITKDFEEKHLFNQWIIFKEDEFSMLYVI